MKKDLSFTQRTDGMWEATTTGVKGAWQLYMQMPKANVTMIVYTRAASDEEWDTIHTRYSSPTVDTIAFMSIVTEDVKIVTEAQPTKANIRMED